MFKGGYCGKVLRINLTSKSVAVEETKSAEVEMLLGGRGLAAKMYYDEIGPDVDPLGPENRMIFMTGPLTGVRLPSTTKFQLATKSPATGIYLCSNCGGTFGPQLKKAGFDGFVLEGCAEQWTFLSIDDGEVVFHDARSLCGMSSSETLHAMKEAAGMKSAAALSIGPAGERLVRLAYINVDTRAFGRGGPGAVLGSKKLKGIVVRGTAKIPVAEPDKVSQIWKEAVADLRTSRAVHTKYGTPQYVEVLNKVGIVPTRNFQSTWFEESAKIDAHEMLKNYTQRNTACYMCPIACGKMNVVKEGPFAGGHARTEYESIVILGANTGVSDFAAIVKATELCDELGMDTISIGHAVALTMELFEKGLITTQETDGIEARFGNAQALVDMVKLIAERRAIGALLCEGMRIVLEKKPEWRPYIITVKGQGLAGYDPRGIFGMSLTYGTSSRGACHNVGGWTVRAEVLAKEYDPYSSQGKGPLVKSLQDNRAYVDSLGVCTMARGSMSFSASPKGEVLEAVTGYPFTPKLLEIGSRIYTLERLIITREGMRRSDDQIPPRIMNDPVQTGPNKGRVVDSETYNRMLDDYYADRGWDSEGLPTPQTIAELGLDKLLS